MRRRSVIFALPAALLVAGCARGGDRAPGVPPPPANASVDGRFGEQGVEVAVRGWNCQGVYGRWRVRVRVEGVATGEGEGAVALRRGRATRFTDQFDVRVAALPARAAVDLRIRVVDGKTLDVRGEASAEALFVRVRAPVRERFPIRRGDVPECSRR